MKVTHTDANFPRTGDGRVYHLGIRSGEVANRLLTVGSPSRAETIATYLDASPKPFRLLSERGFMTITGRYKGVPLTIVSIGMGSPNMDFFVREVRECLAGDMVVVRLGSCGGLTGMPVGSIAIAKSCVAVQRNLDFDFHNGSQNGERPYRISKPVHGDSELASLLETSLLKARPKTSQTAILTGVVNASADSFYSSQGRQTSFPDHNAHLIEELLSSVTDLATLEMESYHLFHLASCWGTHNTPSSPAPPLTTSAVTPTLTPPTGGPTSTHGLAGPDTSIRVSSLHIVFGSRTSQDFITPDEVVELERWTGQAVLDALSSVPLAPEKHHPDSGSVWESRD